MHEVNIQKLFHCTYSLNYHFVFVTKYRRRCLTKAMLDRLQEIVAQLCIAWGGKLMEMNGEADHVHLLVEMNPKASPSSVAANFKTVTSRLLRKEFDDVLSNTYRRPVLWSRAYFVSSCGGAPLSVIKQYIEQQEQPSGVVIAASSGLTTAPFTTHQAPARGRCRVHRLATDCRLRRRGPLWRER